MEEEKLDQYVKNKLSSLETDVPKDAWKAFSDKLKNAETEDHFNWEKKFDLNIYKKLNQFIFPANDKYGWGYFNEYYSRVKRNEKKIIVFKAMEITMAFLLFITTLQRDFFSPFPQIILSDNDAAPVLAIRGNDNLSLALLENKTTEGGSIEKQQVRDRITYTQLHKYDNEVHKTLKDENLFSVDPIPVIKPMELTTPKKSVSLSSFSNIEQLPTLNSMNIPLSPRKIYIRNMLDFGKWHLTLLTGLDGDNVFTPENIRFKVPQITRNSPGFHVGFLLSEGANRLETGIGFIYAHKEYNAPRITFIQGSLRDGYTTEQLKKIQLNLLQIPVFTRYNVVNTDKWKFYASIGATAQLTMAANYYIVHPGFFPSSVGLTGKNSSVYQNLEEGLMQGGTLLDNVYLSLDYGIGVEKVVSSRASLFIQSGYQQFVGHVSKGIGPYNDRISTFSLQSGVRFNLFQPDK